jgi:hypothetical protein
VSHLLNQVIDKNGKPIPAFFIAYAWYFLPNKCETLPTPRVLLFSKFANSLYTKPQNSYAILWL